MLKFIQSIPYTLLLTKYTIIPVLNHRMCFTFPHCTDIIYMITNTSTHHHRYRFCHTDLLHHRYINFVYTPL
eukprot:UN10216